MDPLEDIIRDKKIALVGIISALAFTTGVYHFLNYVEKHFDNSTQIPAVVCYSRSPHQEAEKYQPPRPISDNPHHYIPERK